jgi:hypothetical protein
MITEEQQSKIDYIIDNFNFAKVALVMQAIDWGWASQSGKPGLSVPSVSRLKATARGLLSGSINGKVTGTGGLQAAYHIEDGEEIFSLSFILEERDSEFWSD